VVSEQKSLRSPALGVRRTSNQSDFDVTFSKSCNQGKIARKD